MTPEWKRYWYTSPIAAAWMADEFDMWFNDDVGCEFEWERNKVSFTWLTLTKRFYIHPKSLHLLEPKAGDVMRWNDAVFIYDGASPNPLPAWKGPCSIIQRDGIPFMRPESEEA